MLDPNEKNLKSLLGHQLSKKSEKKFFDRFEREYSKQSSFELWAAGGVAASLILTFGFFYFYQKVDGIGRGLDQGVIVYQELLENYKLLAEVEEEMIDYTEEEWKILLADT